ncbi:Co2+/Mg2+ efflux protein ApaG [Brevundimonas diminuta]|jgi:ApaG protein|uniref:Protein ApaG n=1 Tax=Brevundimonas diminuta TaxID=293 RepID=A0A410NU49_BREDI|nr:Co2+/Mg2+ efflux protein ApaG [Brevundimonas diminuta]MBD3571732.1 Co2+/Mg2+ efflux protein ApaG [Brevundimonas diminuta]MCZ4106865.1 Co2+/Mg2+ efflux protein ApaG [Brevundimonas diminuta]QAT13375.1 Co2+/Mg2+ efflux protein ApaG [Brevundimonas diminuta]QQB89258.1 Co2+/Mg2+ efflux protein ApaG [Brevundimonas diminuta]GEB98954.1 protein ApaG [Brevundimonas diminuta]
MHSAPAYTAETEGVVVRVRPSYLAGQSDPAESRWVWAYQVEIVNLSGGPVQLVARRWTITDALGRVEEVRGPGVVGEQPVIEPGDSYAYASGCPLTTPSGSMVGAYFMQDAEGRMFEAAIPAFSLDVPDARRVLN